MASQGNIKTVLDTLFHSSEFNDPKYYKAKFKTPFQYLVSIVRVSGIKNPDLKKIEWMLNQLAMPIFDCEAPNGYQNTESACLMWLLGGAVKGGKIYGDWTGLSESNLYEKRDLPVNTDFREAIASILTQHLNLSPPQLASVFPGYQSVGNLNLLKG